MRGDGSGWTESYERGGSLRSSTQVSRRKAFLSRFVNDRTSFHGHARHGGAAAGVFLSSRVEAYAIRVYEIGPI